MNFTTIANEIVEGLKNESESSRHMFNKANACVALEPDGETLWFGSEMCITNETIIYDEAALNGFYDQCGTDCDAWAVQLAVFFDETLREQLDQ